MSAEVDTVLHFSEDPAITEFLPHVAETATDQRTAFVWAVPIERAPDYWFPRQCPRGMAWVEADTEEPDRLSLLGPTARRVHLIEYGWLRRLLSVELYVYHLPAANFRPYGTGSSPHAVVARHPVTPLRPPEPVGDLLELHRLAGIELRCVDSIWPWWRLVIESSLGFSGIRLHNAVDAGT